MAARIRQGDSLVSFGTVASFKVGESAVEPNHIHITQYGGEVVAPLTPAEARQLAVNLMMAVDAIEKR